MKLMLLMPDLALIGAQKMGLNLLKNIDNSIFNETRLVVLSDNINDLHKLEDIPNYITLKKYFKGLASKCDTIS